MNELAYVFQAWVPLLVWKQTEMPRARKGIIYTIVLSFTHVAWTFLVLYLQMRDKKSSKPSVNQTPLDRSADRKARRGVDEEDGVSDEKVVD
ncbi:hypothetical protein BS47DRAFT_167208 [Hydnum rufescens UP504]|uniref:Uncharacterized protein n=1 Tax=Hydnum rufescens UP504 TaxID=1448309 RepID=A0A9P6B7E7_9AGAM|nr:hypothetical protein BS47DRAFT_167208 [Hydnum rufescens UP504]